MSKKTTKINPDVFKGIEERDALYEGRGYKIFGPLNHPLGAMGVLVAENSDLIDTMAENRVKMKDLLEKWNTLSFLKILLTVASKKPKAMVDLPPKHYIRLADLGENDDVKETVKTILDIEENRGIYTDDLEAGDFWVDPESHKLFLVALDKLKESGE